MPDIADKILRVENGLIPAIQIQDLPLTKKNLLEEMNFAQIPAVSIAVINDGKIEWAKAYGILSSELDEKANTETLFQAGSISKPVAAFAILSLVDEGLIQPDEDVNLKLTSWKVPENENTKISKVTLRSLLSHSSGCTVIGFDGYKRGDPIPSITETLDGKAPANNSPVRVEFPPSSKMSYSGGGYNVAEQLTVDITQQPFKDFVKKALFKPLEMNRSTFEFLDLTEPNTAYAHPSNATPMKGGWKTYPESAAAGLWTTPTDLAKWLIEIQNGLISKNGSQLLSKDLLEDMTTPQVGIHGLGPVVTGKGMELFLSHKGRTDGFTCGFASFPHLKQGAVVMTNASINTGFVDDVLRSIASEYNWPSYSVKVKKTIKLSEGILEKYIGRYSFCDQSNDIYDLFIFRENDELFAKSKNASNAQKLYPEKTHQFFFIDTGYEVIFNEINGIITGMNIIVQPGFEREFKKL